MGEIIYNKLVRDEIEVARIQKVAKRGAFEQRIYLEKAIFND